MPKYALANDLWIGRLPPALRGLSTGARLLLPLSRAMIKRYNCGTDSGKWMPKEQMIKGYIGNVVAFPQADGGRKVLSIPPRDHDLLRHVQIVLTGGSAADLKRARVEELGVSYETLRHAYDYLRKTNEHYAAVRWDEGAARELQVSRDRNLGLPHCLANCVCISEGPRLPAVRQTGPADAIEHAFAGHLEGGSFADSCPGGAGDEEDVHSLPEDEVAERGEYCAAVADQDMQGDLCRAMKKVEVSLRKAQLLAAKKERQNAAFAATTELAEYEDKDLVARLRASVDDVRKAAQSCNQWEMQRELDKAEQDVQRTAPPPGVFDASSRAQDAPGARGRSRRQLKVVVPTGDEPVSMFSPGFWSSFDPIAFPYGDGVFGLERDVELTYEQWCRCLMDREELDYGLPGEIASPPASASPSDASSTLPRWRANPDLLTAQYCLWRRKKYIQQTRLFVRRQRYGDTLHSLARVTPEELYSAVGILGRGAGLKEALSNPNVSSNVKQALRAMLISNATIVGSDAHRTTLRHISSSYRLLFGPPLVFMTPNIADTRSLLVSLHYEGKDVVGWRVLEENAPEMPSVSEMLRRVSADPVSQALVTNLLLELFLVHVVGVLPTSELRSHADGMAASGAPGVFGFVRAYFGPVETQGRGGIHPHIHVWVLSPMTGAFLARVKAGMVEDLDAKLAVWRSAVLEKVASIQFDSVEEVGRQLGMQERVRPLPLSDQARGRAFMDGALERDDLAVELPRRSKPDAALLETYRAWTEGLGGPRRLRSYAPLAPAEPDPHELVGYPMSRDTPMTGAHLTLQPQYRRKPPYATMEDGSAQIVVPGDLVSEAQAWARYFLDDARMCAARSHNHRCGPTCWKLQKDGDEVRKVKVCRFGFWHEYETAVYSGVNSRSQPVPAAACKVFKRLRAGKELVLPRGACFVDVDCGTLPGTTADDEPVVFEPEPVMPEASSAPGLSPNTKRLELGNLQEEDFLPRVNRSQKYGRAGRVEPLRYHPMHGSTNAAAQVALRCNFDVQALDRVFVFDEELVDGPGRDQRGESDWHCGDVVKEAAGPLPPDTSDSASVEAAEAFGRAHHSGPRLLGGSGDVDGAAGHVRVQGHADSGLAEALSDGDEDDIFGGGISWGRAQLNLLAGLDDSDASIWEEEEEDAVAGLCDAGADLDGEGLMERGEDAGGQAALDSPCVAVGAANGDSRSARDKLVHAFEAMFMDATAVGHYQTDYYTKGGPLASDVGVLQQQMLGIRHLREEQEAESTEDRAARLGTSGRWEQVVDSARKTLIRLTTSANKALLKKLPEMAFQMLFGHDCYCSHSTWTIFCKGIVALAFQASTAVRTGRGDLWDDAAAADIEVEPPVDDDDAGGDAGSVMGHLGESRGTFCPVRARRAQRARTGGDEHDEGGAGQYFRVAAEHDLKTNWLHRGDREPLFSMGIYHYAMYVHTAYGDPSRVDVADFVTYPFADTHPAAATRVQKLRVGTTFMVPRLFGFTMPTKFKDAETNAMFKSVLLRPLRAVEHAAPWVPYKGIVGPGGEFKRSWEDWWQKQLRLLWQYEECERRAGKWFTLEDIDLTLAPESPLDERRARPSAAEFMARWTAEVATNMDLGAEAKGRPRTRVRPDGKEFEPEEIRAVDAQTPGHGAAEDGPDDGSGPPKPADDGEVDEAWAQMQARFPIPPGELLKVAMYEGYRGSSRSLKYKEQFVAGYGKQHDPRHRIRSEVGTKPFVPMQGLRDLTFDDIRRDQIAVLKKKKPAVILEQSVARGVVGIMSGRVQADDGPLAARIDEVMPCTTAPALRPRDYAAQLMAEVARRDNNPVVFSQEQTDVIALIVGKMEEILCARDMVSRGETPTRVSQLVLLLHGQGGTGKTEVVALIRRILKRFFGHGGDIAAAQSNSAARVIGGQTIHSAFDIPARGSLALSSLSLPKASLIDALKDVVAVIFEEVSMIESALLGAASYKMCCARRQTHNCDPLLYSEREHMFGAAPIVLFLGDFYQLRPMSRAPGVRESLLDRLPETAKAHKRNGQRIFLDGVNHAMFLYKTHRFVDRLVSPSVPCTFMPDFLQAMRDGKGLTDQQWEQVQGWVVRRPADRRVDMDAMREGFEMGIAWEAVAREMQYRSLREALAAKQVLVYVQAVDLCKHVLPHNEYRQMLQVVNINTTAKMLGLCPLYIGMRVRLTVRISEPVDGAVQDAVGEVLNILFHEKEFDMPGSDWRANPGHEARRQGYVRLRYSPRGVLVRFDDVNLDVGLGKGVLLVQNYKGTWIFNAHEEVDGQRVQRKRDVTRYQIPLVPEKVRTVQTAQGLGMDAATMTLAKPANMNEDDWWLHVYVMLSRVRVAHRILVYELPPRGLFERGPPRFVRDGVRRFEHTMESRTRALSRQFVLEFGWHVQNQVAGLQDQVGSFTCDPRPADTSVCQASPASACCLDDVPLVFAPEAALPVPDNSNRWSLGMGEQAQCTQVGGSAVIGQSQARGPASSPAVQACARSVVLSAADAASRRPNEVNMQEVLAPLGMDLMKEVYGEVAPTSHWSELWYGEVAARRGIPNLRNTCFVNSIAQILLRLAPLRSMLQKHAERCRKNWVECGLCSLAQQAQILFEPDVGSSLLGAAERAPAAVAARRGLFADEFRGDAQADALQFAEILLERVAEAEAPFVPVPAREQRRHSVVDAHLCGRVYLQRRICRGCGQVNDLYAWDRFLRLNPAQASHADGICSLEGLISEQKTSVERLDRCPNDGTACPGPSEKHHFVKTDPLVLLIVLNRHTGYLDGHRDMTRVRFPLHMEGIAGENVRYRFAGVVCHLGEQANAGHYVAYCEVGNSLYCRFDDDHVGEPSSWDVLFESAAVQTQAYLLVYLQVCAESAVPALPRGVAPSTGVSVDSPSSSSVLSPGPSGVSGPPAGSQVPSGSRRHVPKVSDAQLAVGTACSVGLRSDGGPAVFAESAALDVPSSERPSATDEANGDSAVCKRRKLHATAKQARVVSSDNERAAVRRKRKLHMDVHSEGTAGIVRGDHVVPDASRGQLRDFTPSIIDDCKCLARVWAGGEGGQCSSKRVPDSRYCKRHSDMHSAFMQNLPRGNGWHGPVDGEIPASKLAEFRSHRQKASRSRLDVHAGGGCGDLGVADLSLDDAVHTEGARAMSFLHRQPESAPGPAVDRGRIVSGFGAERVDDVDAQRRTLDAQMAKTASARAKDGSRGRAVDMQGNDLDRGEGVGWRSGRRRLA